MTTRLTVRRMSRTQYSSRERLGIALLFGAPALALTLHFSGVPMMVLRDSRTLASSPSGTAVVQVYQPQWPIYVFGAIALLGFVLLFLRRREKPNA